MGCFLALHMNFRASVQANDGRRLGVGILFSAFIQCLVGGGSISKFSGGSNLMDPKGFMNGNISNF